MEAKFYSETSVTTHLHGVTTQKSTLLPLITAMLQNSVCCAVGRAWRLLADSRPMLWQHCSNWAGAETARSIQVFWGATAPLGILNSSRCVGKLAILQVDIWVTWLCEDQVGVCKLFKQCVLPPPPSTFAAGDDVAGGQRIRKWCRTFDKRQVRKWKLLFVNNSECRSQMFSETKFLNSLQDGAVASLWAGIVFKMMRHQCSTLWLVV